MERLTRRKDGRTYIVGCPDFALPKIVGLIIQQTVDRLAAYEDTELEPDTISKIRNIVLDISGNLDRLRELAQADKEGRCVVLDDLTVADLQQMLTVLNSTRYGDGVETYTTGYRNGHRNGRIEILHHMLGINEGDSAEATLRREQDE